MIAKLPANVELDDLIQVGLIGLSDALSRFDAAVHKLEQRHGRALSEGEIAREMGLSLTDYQELLGKVRGTQLIHLQDVCQLHSQSFARLRTRLTQW